MCVIYILYIKNRLLYKKSIDPDIKVGYEINKAVPSTRIVPRSGAASGKEQMNKNTKRPKMSDTQSAHRLIAFITACFSILALAFLFKADLSNKKITFTKEEKSHLSVGEKN